MPYICVPQIGIMNYIGSKNKLNPFILENVTNTVGEDLSQITFCDLFAGTGIVGRNFKKRVKKVISNDFEYYSFVLNRNYIGNHLPIPREDTLLEELNHVAPQKGLISRNYCLSGKEERQYFSNANGKKIDGIRSQIEEWKSNDEIDDSTYFFLLASLLESADKVANTASVYGAYLKELKKSAQKELVLLPAEFELNENGHEVYNEDSNELISRIEGDVLYLDPPYNARQYGSNYHLLNTIALYDEFTPKGKTGLRNYNKSKYCSRAKVVDTFRELIEKSNFKYIFLSYNNEGLMPIDEIQKIMKDLGHYQLESTDYQRFKSDKTESRNHKFNKTTEYLHVLEKN